MSHERNPGLSESRIFTSSWREVLCFKESHQFCIRTQPEERASQQTYQELARQKGTYTEI